MGTRRLLAIDPSLVNRSRWRYFSGEASLGLLIGAPLIPFVPLLVLFFNQVEETIVPR